MHRFLRASKMRERKRKDKAIAAMTIGDLYIPITDEILTNADRAYWGAVAAAADAEPKGRHLAGLHAALDQTLNSWRNAKPPVKSEHGTAAEEGHDKEEGAPAQG